MFNALYPKVYRQLRERAGLTQEELADELGISRFTVNKVESGRAHLTAQQEQTLLELAQCTKEEAGELMCEALSEYLDKKVGIQNDHGAYEPSTALAMAYAVLREFLEELPADMRRTLNSRINTTQLLGYAFDKNNADLVELVHDYREIMNQRRREQSMTAIRN